MDFHTLSRRDLQSLCKRNRIPANVTNLAMADALQALPQVEGVGEILEALQVQSAQKSTPAQPRNGRRTAVASRKKVVVVEEKEEEPREGQASPLPGARRVSATAVKFMSLGGDEAMEEGVKKKEAAETPRAPTTRRRVGSKKTEEGALEAPATGQKTATSRRRAAKKDEEEKEKLGGATAGRRTRQSATAADLISGGLRRSARVRGKEAVKMESLTKDEAAGDVVSGFEGSPVSGLISSEQKELIPEIAAEISPEELNLQPELPFPDESPADDEVTAPATCNLASKTPVETKAAEFLTEVVESVEDNGEILAGNQDVEAPATCDQINLAAEIVDSAVVNGEIKEDGEDESEPSFDVLVDNGEIIGEENGEDSGESDLSFDVIVDDGEITQGKEKDAGESELSFDVVVDGGMKEENEKGGGESDPSFDVLVGERSAGSDSFVESPLEIAEAEEAGIKSAAGKLVDISPEESEDLMGSLQSEMAADAIESSVGGGSLENIGYVVGEIIEKGDESIPEKSKISEVTGDISEEAIVACADDGEITEESEDESGTEDTNSLAVEVPVESKVSEVTGEISAAAVLAGADDGEITEQSEDESGTEDTDSLTVEVPVEEDESGADLDNGILAGEVPVEAVSEQKPQPPAEVRELIDHLADLKLSSAMKIKSAGAEQPAAAVVKSDDKENSSLLTVLTAGPTEGGGEAKAKPKMERPKPKYEEMSLTKLRAAYKETLSTISNKGEEKRAALRAIDDNCMT